MVVEITNAIMLDTCVPECSCEINDMWKNYKETGQMCTIHVPDRNGKPCENICAIDYSIPSMLFSNPTTENCVRLKELLDNEPSLYTLNDSNGRNILYYILSFDSAQFSNEQIPKLLDMLFILFDKFSHPTYTIKDYILNTDNFGRTIIDHLRQFNTPESNAVLDYIIHRFS